jgi:hypothetical protein
VRQLREAVGEGRALRLRLGDEGAERAPQLGVGGRDPVGEGGRQLVLLPLEGGQRLPLAGLEPLLAGLADLREALGEDHVGLANEGLDRAVELAREPGRGFPRAERIVESNWTAAASA